MVRHPLPLLPLPLHLTNPYTPSPDAHGHHAGSHAAHGPEGQLTSPEEDAGTLSEKPEGKRSLSIEERTRSASLDRTPSLDMSSGEEDIEAQKPPHHHHDQHHHHHGASHEDEHHSSIPQIIGVAILEFGVILHRWIASSLLWTCVLISFAVY